MKINMAVLFGGRSVEHEISVITALQAVRSIDKEKYHIIPVYITKDNEFYTGDALLEIENFRDIQSLLDSCRPVSFFRKAGKSYLIGEKSSFFAKHYQQELDIAFPIVHGTHVEDGTLQGLLELTMLPYIGCDVAASAKGMDKAASKAILKAAGLPVLDCTEFYTSTYFASPEAILDRIEAEQTYPVIIKPVNLGSSIGVYFAANRASLMSGIEQALEFSNHIMVENAIEPLMEINCSVLGDIESARPSPCEEPVNSSEILSYEDKYMSGGKTSKGMSTLKRRLPAEIPDEMTKAIQDYAARTFQALGCTGVARVDFLVRRSTGEIWVNEINTIPGSLSFYLWDAAGLKYPELIEELVSLAFKRQREQSGIHYSFDANILANFSFGGSKGGKN